jgi:hypothetical protein
MTREETVFDFGRPHMNVDHIRNLSAPVGAACARHTHAVAVAEAGNERTAQFTARCA